MTKNRFSKALALKVLDARAAAIRSAHKFTGSKGSAQLDRPEGLTEAQMSRAIEYGRMLAFQEFACAIEENFEFEKLPKVLAR